MVKQLYYSKIHSKNIEIICLSYILASILELMNSIHKLFRKLDAITFVV